MVKEIADGVLTNKAECRREALHQALMFKGTRADDMSAEDVVKVAEEFYFFLTASEK